MIESKFKTLRHIEAVRNYIDFIKLELLKESEQHLLNGLKYPFDHSRADITKFNLVDLIILTSSWRCLDEQEYFDFIKTGIRSIRLRKISFNTLRMVDSVPNRDHFNFMTHVNFFITKLTEEAHAHDQSKLQSPEAELFENTPRELRDMTFGSTEYEQNKRTNLKKAMQQHYKNNRHHPEHFPNGILGMNFVDIIVMMCDWQASTLRHDDGDIYRSLDVCQARFEYSNDMKQIMLNTVNLLNNSPVKHWAHES